MPSFLDRSRHVGAVRGLLAMVPCVALLGARQVGKTTLAGRIASAYGTPFDDGDDVTRLFPRPSQLAEAPLESAGVMPARAI